MLAFESLAQNKAEAAKRRLQLRWRQLSEADACMKSWSTGTLVGEAWKRCMKALDAMQSCSTLCEDGRCAGVKKDVQRALLAARLAADLAQTSNEFQLQHFNRSQRGVEMESRFRWLVAAVAMRHMAQVQLPEAWVPLLEWLRQRGVAEFWRSYRSTGKCRSASADGINWRRVMSKAYNHYGHMAQELIRIMEWLDLHLTASDLGSDAVPLLAQDVEIAVLACGVLQSERVALRNVLVQQLAGERLEWVRRCLQPLHATESLPESLKNILEAAQLPWLGNAPAAPADTEIAHNDEDDRAAAPAGNELAHAHEVYDNVVGVPCTGESNDEDLLLLAQDETQPPQTTAVGLKRAMDDFFAMQAEEQAATAETLVPPSKRLCLRKVL